MKYICNICDDICGTPCILEVEDGAAHHPNVRMEKHNIQIGLY